MMSFHFEDTALFHFCALTDHINDRGASEYALYSIKSHLEDTYCHRGRGCHEMKGTRNKNAANGMTV